MSTKTNSGITIGPPPNNANKSTTPAIPTLVFSALSAASSIFSEFY